MENLFNTVILVGRAGSDTEIRYFNDGKAKGTVSMAVTRRRGSENAEELTDWFRIEFWGRDAEIAAEYVKKGTLFGVEGRINCNRWKDANTGEEREAYTIVASSLRLLSSKRDAQVTP